MPFGLPVVLVDDKVEALFLRAPQLCYRGRERRAHRVHRFEVVGLDLLRGLEIS